jgi:hypothetical protein
MRIVPGLAVLCLFLLDGAPLSASAHDGHMAHGSGKAARAELGTSAAFDAQGRLWVASKETTKEGQYVVLQMSADMGKTWSAPQRIQREPEPVSAEGENRPKIAFGKRGELYVTYTKPLAKPYTGEIRFVRSTDGGKTFAAPVTVHANRDVITHRFDSLIVDRDGRVYVAWIDKRDLEAAAVHKKKYAGAALYYAVSDDGGASFKGDYKIADHSCECCRIALALNHQGRPVAMWRQIFAPNARDHALVELTPDGNLPAFSRVTFDDWRIDACPHHGPSLAFAADGTRHQVWFNVKGDEGGVFYAAADSTGKQGPIMRLGSAQAEHADVAVQGEHVVLAWKQFDGKSTAILAKLSGDGGRHWRDAALAHTEGASDQPRLLNGPSGIVLVWRTANEGVQTILAERK